jgi:VIT1/CCC1 family predicted Fe2+/Mn2+ transporter
MIDFDFKDIVRIILEIILMVFVWENSHWSVALSLILITISLEMLGFILSILIKIYKKELERKLGEYL